MKKLFPLFLLAFIGFTFSKFVFANMKSISASLNFCSNSVDIGYERGKASFNYYINSCSEYWLLSGWLAGQVDSVASYKTHAPSLYDNCHRSGWLRGFIDAQEVLWNPCYEQLDEIKKKKLDERIIECSEFSENLGNESTHLLDSIENELNSTFDDRDELKKKMFLFESLGKSEESWQLLLDKTSHEGYSFLPCLFVLSSSLDDY